MSNQIKIINISLGAILAVFALLYTFLGGLYFKSIASTIFVIIAVANTIYMRKNKQDNKYAYIMAVGLVFACLGDIVLEINFIYGAILFAVGHLFFFFSYTAIKQFRIKDLMYGAFIFVPCAILILFVPIFEFSNTTLQMLCVVYALVISTMLGKSISNFIQEKSKINTIAFIGSVLFTFSDLMLLMNIFSVIEIYLGTVSLFGLLCLTTYYTAEFMLAHSVLYSQK